ncbi:solute carrier family 22 member 6-B-like [Haliotis rufescens]|uniref:solute carrier family 22 member 6-B-like n=1 Tax=Haliotis rufescens TaxID=6454 RepID=UPI00201F0C8D|nr:solute carrier family 22 member 6-B-like [Haliotis rufescens]XP_048252018.1 solute carrier family 22 member 6-B-like [Haliotis rufescens]XP_048252019.1 solute carrier family 22 member 6-B-like [Haliotis rufescens]
MGVPEKYQHSSKDKVSSLSLKMDELIGMLGSPGRYQVIIFILLCLNYCPLVFNHVIMAFFGAKTAHSCDPLHGSDVYVQGGQNVTVVGRTAGQCRTTLRLENNDNITLTCGAGDWTYMVEERETNIVTEWDLVCDDSYLRPLATTIYFCGVMLGGLLFGYLSDKFGRRPVMLGTLFAPVVLGIGIFFVPSYTWFVVLRFIEGIFLQGLQISSYVLVAEMFLPAYRPIAGGIIECFWGASVMALAVITFLIRDWRYVQLAICLPSLLAAFYICIMPESLRWMVMYGKLDGAEKLVEKMAKFNKKEFPRESWMSVRAIAEGRQETLRQKYAFLTLLKTPRLRKRSLILFYQWLAVSVGYYGLTLRITSLKGNKYIIFLIGASVEMAAYLLDIIIMKYAKRRYSVVTFALLAAVTCIVAGALPSGKTASELHLTLSTGFAIVGRFAVAALFSLYFLYTSELYPTVIRNIGMGTCAFWTRVGGVIAPQINSLGHYTSESVPVIVFGVMMLISGILAIMLPETHLQQLPDTIDDIEGEKLHSAELTETVNEKELLKQGTQEKDGAVSTRL